MAADEKKRLDLATAGLQSLCAQMEALASIMTESCTAVRQLIAEVSAATEGSMRFSDDPDDQDDPSLDYDDEYDEYGWYDEWDEDEADESREY